MAYRAESLRCPACGELLQAESVHVDGASVFLDRCVRCGGVFLDWHDGEPERVVRAFEASPASGSASRSVRADAACPRCHVPLHREEKATLAGFRCPECFALFLTAASVEALRELPEPVTLRRPPCWERVLAWLRG